ncbi:MAG: Uma2 family endonuclease [Gemmataceae bacterium]
MVAKQVAQLETLGDLLVSLGRISPMRVFITPTPGTATVWDVARLLDRDKRLVELVDGTLVEKVYGIVKSVMGVQIGYLLSNWNEQAGKVGWVAGASGPFRLGKKLVRIPDVSFTRWTRLQGRKVPTESVPLLAPTLAVEVLSEGNTRLEMERKLKEYFLAGVLLVWLVDPKRRTVRVFTSPDDVTELGVRDTLDGGDVLPGFAVPVARLFADLGDAPRPAKKKKKR